MNEVNSDDCVGTATEIKENYQLKHNFSLTEREGRTGENWSKVLAVQTDGSEVPKRLSSKLKVRKLFMALASFRNWLAIE